MTENTQEKEVKEEGQCAAGAEPCCCGKDSVAEGECACAKEEAAKEQHDCLVRPGVHDILVFHRFDAFDTERQESRIGNRQNHQHDDQSRCRPNGERLQNPVESGHHKNGNHANFNGVEGVGAVNSQRFVRNKEGSNRKDCCNDEFDEFCLSHAFVHGWNRVTRLY